jgi:sugar/nucleoside kinase (ribokinase family)
MAAGHLCLDLLPSIPDTGTTRLGDLMRPGKLINVGPVTLSTGGCVSNTGIAMKRLGNSVRFCANVGDDDLGRLVIDLLRSNGNAEGITVMSGRASSYTIVIAPPNVDRVFLHNPETNNEFGPESLNAEQIADCRLFHFGYAPLMRRMFEDNGREFQNVLQIAKNAGATTSCDMALPDPDSDGGKANWRAIFENVLPYVDIFVPSLEETFYALHPDKFLEMKKAHDNDELIHVLTAEDYSRLADEVLAMGPKIVTLKSGSKGFYIKTRSESCFEELGNARPGDPGNWSGRELWAPALAVENFRNANGTGDASIAGFLTAFLRGSTIEDALRIATCCGMQIAESADTTSGLRSWDETVDMACRKRPLLNLSISSEGWTWSDTKMMWSGPDDPLG